MWFKLEILFIILSFHRSLANDLLEFDLIKSSLLTKTVSTFVNDGLCDGQLSLFREAFFKREMWALRCKQC